MELPTPGIRLAAFAVASRTTPLPAAVHVKTKIQLLDTLAAILSGSPLEAAVAAQRFVKLQGTPSQASVLGTSIKVNMIDAALANGMALHADESDDSHETSQTHPGCCLPAALAVAEHVGATGEQLLRAMCLGYEMTIRFGEALQPGMSFARSSLSCHAFGPLFGAGFAAGSLLGFDQGQFLVLLNYLAQEASGLTTWRLDQAHTLKSYVFSGMPAHNGVKCALMVHSGFTGAGDVLGHDRNFFDAISPNKVLRLNLDDLGHGYKMLEVDIKKYSVGFPIAAPLSALEDILQRSGAKAHDIKSIEVTYNPDWYKVVGDRNKMPDLNLRHCLAATVVEGFLSFAASHDESKMQDPAIIAVGQRITLKDSDANQDWFEARVEVVLVDGRVLSARQDRNVLGRIQNPMTVEQSDSKVRELLGTVMEEGAVDALVSAVHELEKAQDLKALFALMVRL